ncbi:YhgE/Pip domain-containing protein [Terribacillus saccharophilus]|uniref:YhgE/Pip domain-containing protein n=1 Tax=Terribacillus saccharophilus TaxID=361277 RepID=UPI0039819A3C
MKGEWKSLIKNKASLTGLIAVLFIPILYCGTFLWAFWDPYSETDNLSVAVVNHDEAADINGTQLNFGNEIIGQLEQNENFGWEFVSEEEAMEGLQDRRYFMMVEIPSDFSNNAATAFSTDSSQPTLRYMPHESLNFLVSTIERSGVEKLQQEVSSTLTSSYLKTLAETMTQTSNGMTTASESTTQLADNIARMQDTYNISVQSNPNLAANQKEQLTSSFSAINDGANSLATSLSDGSEQLQNINLTQGNLDMIASPVKINTDKFTSVPNYGHGFAPFTLSLGLFIGAMLISIVFPVRKPVIKPKSSFEWFISKFSIIAVAASIQGIIAAVFLLSVLDLEVGNIGYFLLFTVFSSLVFVTLIQLAVSLLGEKGRFIIILLLILQITSSGGTFPVEMIPAILQEISAFLPMTYSISGFRALVANSNYDLMWLNIGLLSIFAFISILGTFIHLTIKYNRNKDKDDHWEVSSKNFV